MEGHLVAIRGGEEGADGEEVALDGHEHLVDARHRLDGASHPKDGVELVDVTVGLDADVVLGDAAATEEPGGALVAGFRIDLHRRSIYGNGGLGGACFVPTGAARCAGSSLGGRRETPLLVGRGSVAALLARLSGGRARSARTALMDPLPHPAVR